MGAEEMLIIWVFCIILPCSWYDWFVHVGIKVINAIKNYVSGWKAPEKLQEAIEDCLVGWFDGGARKSKN